MPIDASIALSGKPVEIADPLTQYGKMAAIQNAQNQNALAQFQLGAAQRSEADTEVLRNALAGKTPGTPEYRQAVLESFSKTGNIKGAQEFLKSETEGDNTRAELGIK